MTDFDLAKSVTRLNDGQRDCLRLVLGHMNSKEIGRELGVSPHTVDQRLRSAMRIMDASSRFEAARKFVEYDDDNPYQSLIYQSPDVEKSSETVSLGLSAKQEGRFTDDLIASVSDINGGGAAVVLQRPAGKPNRLPLPRYRGEKNEMTAVEKLGWIVAIAIGSAVSFGGILAGLEALSRLRG